MGSKLHHTFQQSMHLSNYALQAPRWTQVGPKPSQDSANIHPASHRMASKVLKMAPTIIKNPGVDADLPSWVHLGYKCSAGNCSANMRPHDRHLSMGF